MSRAASHYAMEAPSSTAGARTEETRSEHVLSAADVDAYHSDGFVIARGLFQPEEASALLSSAIDGVITDNAHGVEDASGKISKLSLFNTPGVNIFGAVSR